ncbi:hypothetical protein L210DRAFT_943288 [Boletus edulis BED1]|uniref:Secreted protein n=1 Tax=Boletus edulis BED1 TaxID=1328754 RepID=A0AAD4BSX1_BOLED|nr:hypothetical protein L210DRAFT_943288 [Boletus edulis BED1]
MCRKDSPPLSTLFIVLGSIGHLQTCQWSCEQARIVVVCRPPTPNIRSRVQVSKKGVTVDRALWNNKCSVDQM